MYTGRGAVLRVGEFNLHATLPAKAVGSSRRGVAWRVGYDTG
jgi:hypothetical protein